MRFNQTQARQGAVTVAGQTFTVLQDGGSPSADLLTVGGRAMSADNKPARGALVTFLNNRTGETQTTMANQFGYFHFGNIERGQSYNVTISHKRYKFSGTRAVTYFSSALIVIFTADAGL